MVPARGVTRFLNVHAEIDDVGEDLNVALWLHVAAHQAEGHQRCSVFHDETGNNRVKRTLAWCIDVRGFRVERVVRNLTETKRTGEMNAPFKLGDQILVTYRINTRKKQNYVALEDSLPAGLETVNPNLAMIGKFFEIPVSDQPERALTLSYSEMRDRSTLLYFDNFEPGSGTYSVLARATAAGTFRWPATQVVPMYDSRFSGLSPSSVCVISGE